ncbi:hypothetical protein [Alkalibacillus haloalkaliphilus]|uniref:hypothetical protein n=1 Tax=Alkalibacillus haloalkaliphilus TaxID=94136 RepID=UPI0029367F2B|nr:hypothetical protein [Alkalibacillus haloalkaliphilus]MDV2582401.1 hypothetical protein [Alkalibacillus haloalkaliphilus]
MRKAIFLVMLISISLVVACSDSGYSHDDTAAVVKGEEITVGEVRFVFNVHDENLRNSVEMYIVDELIIDEVRNEMGIDLTDEVESYVEADPSYPFDDIDPEAAERMRDLVEEQADRFNMEPEEYHEAFSQASAERTVYQDRYFLEKIDDPDSNEIDQSIYGVTTALVDKYEDEIEIYIEE